MKKQFVEFFKKFHIKAVLATAMAVVFVISAFSPNLHLLASSPSSPSPEARNIMNGITTRQAPSRPGTMGLELTGTIPIARIPGNPELTRELENRFNAQYNNFIRIHRTSSISLHFTTDVHVSSTGSEEFVSVVMGMEATSASTFAAAATTVIRVADGEIITLAEYAPNIIQLANNHIRDIIAQSPRGFVANFQGIGANHPFFLEDNRLVLIFASAELRPAARSLQTVELNLDNIQNAQINDNGFIVLPPDQYSATMVRLRDALDMLGHAVVWNNETRGADIVFNEQVVASVFIDENTYVCRLGSSRTLEVAPMLHRGRTYVPLSFFDEILGMATTITSDGQIIISKYNHNAVSEQANGAYEVDYRT